jgi:hypothetical protein
MQNHIHFIWKIRDHVRLNHMNDQSRSIVKIYRGADWFMEETKVTDELYEGYSYILEDISTTNDILVQKIQVMPKNWVGEKFLEEQDMICYSIKKTKNGVWDIVGDYERVILFNSFDNVYNLTNAEVICNELDKNITSFQAKYVKNTEDKIQEIVVKQDPSLPQSKCLQPYVSHLNESNYEEKVSISFQGNHSQQSKVNTNDDRQCLKSPSSHQLSCRDNKQQYRQKNVYRNQSQLSVTHCKEIELHAKSRVTQSQYLDLKKSNKKGHVSTSLSLQEKPSSFSHHQMTYPPKVSVELTKSRHSQQYRQQQNAAVYQQFHSHLVSPPPLPPPLPSQTHSLQNQKYLLLQSHLQQLPHLLKNNMTYRNKQTLESYPLTSSI